MCKKATYQLWALGVLVAFCHMMVVKELHHHETHHTHEHLCVLDHLPLGECKHAHTSVIAFDSDEDDCAICHFVIAKLFQPKYIITPVVTTHFSVLQEGEYYFQTGFFYAHCFGRAPPAVVV